MTISSTPNQHQNTLLEDGGWCWFHEPRVAVVGGSIWFGSVSSGWRDPEKKGSAVAFEWIKSESRVIRHILGFPQNAAEEVSWTNDHNAPALLRLPTGKILATYTLHGADNKIRYRRFSSVLRRWSKERIFQLSEDSRVTYSNLVYLTSERRVYNFFRGLDGSWKPSWIYSDTNGRNWRTGGILIDFPHPRKHRPYLKVASNGFDEIHFAYTEAHPRDFPTNVYHVIYKSSIGLTTSEGIPISSLAKGLTEPTQGSLVYSGDAEHTPWVISVNLYDSGRVFILYSVRNNGLRNQDRGTGTSDLDYFLAEWDGQSWKRYFVARAGPQLYFKEEDYSGLFTQDPGNPRVVYISTKVSPISGESLSRWEIFKGETSDFNTWIWCSVTSDSDQDNIRPFAFSGKESGVIWLQGTMRTYKDYQFQVLAVSD